MKLILGTVQFGVTYGINNATGIPSDEEIQHLLRVASGAGISMLDTASAYGDAEKKIARLSGNTFDIITKFSKVATGKALTDQLEKSCENLSSASVNGFLAHNAADLLAYPELWPILQDLKKNGKAMKIGYSLYSCDQLEALLSENMIPDLVQIPFSLLDRKFEPWLPLLKEKGVEVHSRSVFLQGLYLMDPQKLPEKLLPLKKYLEQLIACCKEYNVSMNVLALNYVAENPYIDKIVIGVDSAIQLNENLASLRTWKTNPDIPACINQIQVAEKELLNPANW